MSKTAAYCCSYKKMDYKTSIWRRYEWHEAALMYLCSLGFPWYTLRPWSHTMHAAKWIMTTHQLINAPRLRRLLRQSNSPLSGEICVHYGRILTVSIQEKRHNHIVIVETCEDTWFYINIQVQLIDLGPAGKTENRFIMSGDEGTKPPDVRYIALLVLL